MSLRIRDLQSEIEDLETQLSAVSGKPGRALPPIVIDANGQTIEPEELKSEKQNPLDVPSLWTRITAKVTSSNKDDDKVTSESASGFAVKEQWGLSKVSGGASHTSASANAMTKMSSSTVEIAFDAMLVEIERPWMHPELFSDHELD